MTRLRHHGNTEHPSLPGQKPAELAAAEPTALEKRSMMSLTDYAGIAGLIAAAAVAIWMLRNHRTINTTSARHRGAPTLRLPRPAHPERASSRSSR